MFEGDAKKFIIQLSRPRHGSSMPRP